MPESPFRPTVDRNSAGAAADLSITAEDTPGPGLDAVKSSERYRLGSEIARGGMGAVFHATDTVFHRDVAIKVLLDKYNPSSGTARRFADEARITAQLQHPNIPAVHDLGTLPDGRPFLAMKLIKGNTLDVLLKSRPNHAADRGRMIAVFEQICQAVAYAHAHNVIHRDLKPGNVMVGSFGEVQVMDWGLAKVLPTGGPSATDPDATTALTAIQPNRAADDAFTQAGSVLGTPAFMPPEQAVGAIHKVDARSDVFGLGAILAVILTGKPPFTGSSVETTRLQAAQGNVEECFARLDASGAEPELVALCKRCLSKQSTDRPANAGEVARAVATLRAAADERARLAETERARAETQAIEQRKRRKVQLALASVLLLAAIVGSIAVVQVQAQREQDRRVADERSQQKERDVKAAAMVQALATAEPGTVPLLIKQIASVQPEARPHVRQLAALPIDQRAGLHGRLARMADDEAPDAERSRAHQEIVDYFMKCRGDELALLIDFLGDRLSANNVAALWALVTEFSMDGGGPMRHVRRAALLARLDPGNERWASYAHSIVPQLAAMSSLEVAPFVEALQPVRKHLLPALMKRYPESRARIEAGKLPVTELVAEASATDLMANIIARYAADRPTDLAELALMVDRRHWRLVFNAIQGQGDAVAPLLEAEIGKVLPVDLPASDERRDVLARRQANAAAILVRLDRPARAWPLLRHSADPRTRSYLIHRLFPLGADPRMLARRLNEETEPSARRALVLALGEYDEATLPAPERMALLPRVQQMYRDDPGPGMHAAAEWLLRQWKQDDWIKQTTNAWASDQQHRVQRLSGIAAANKDGARAQPRWYVNSQGQTYTVIPGPVELMMGSPVTEKDQQEQEDRHRRRIGRSFAIASTAVTLADYRRLTRDKYDIDPRHSQSPDVPVVGINWYMAATYCNLLSKEDGIPEDQWCYEIKGPHDIVVKRDYLSLRGYRLPTEAEMEYAIRAGATTSRHYGETEELLSNYAWYTKNSDDLLQPVGRKKPNDLGLFDALGNCYCWCQDEYDSYPRPTGDEAIDDRPAAAVIAGRSRVLRGGSFGNPASTVRSACRDNDTPIYRGTNYSIRPARTIVP